jgi:hypothetical protein
MSARCVLKYSSALIPALSGIGLGVFGACATKFARRVSVEAAGDRAGWSRQKATMIRFASYSACQRFNGVRATSCNQWPSSCATNRLLKTSVYCPYPDKPSVPIAAKRSIAERRDGLEHLIGD